MQRETSLECFLKETYGKILKACLQDEALQTLKSLEDTNFPIQRINEIYVQIYQEQREHQIRKLSQELDSLRERVLEEGHFSQNTLLFLQQENQKLRLIVQNKEREQLLAIEKCQQEKELLKQSLQKISYDIKSNSQNTCIEDLKRNIIQVIKEKDVLQEKLEEEVNLNEKTEKRMVEIKQKYEQIKFKYEQDQHQIQFIFNQRHVLQEKYSIMQQDNEQNHEKIQNLQKNIKALKKKINQIESLNEIKNSIENNQYEKMKENQECVISLNLMSKLNKNQQRQLELVKELSLLKAKLYEKQKECSELYREKEQKVVSLNDQLNKIKIYYEKLLILEKGQSQKFREQQKIEAKESSNQILYEVKKQNLLLLSEKQKKIEGLNNKIYELNKVMMEKQNILENLKYQYNVERKKLQNTCENNQINSKEIFKNYYREKNEGDEMEKIFKSKIQILEKQISSSKATIMQKQKEIKDQIKRNQILQDQNKRLKKENQEIQHKRQQEKNNIFSLEVKNAQNKQFFREKQRQIRQLQQKNKTFFEVNQQKDQTILDNKKSIKRFEQKLKEVNNQYELLLISKNKLTDQYEKQLQQIYEKQQRKREDLKKSCEQNYKYLFENQLTKILIDRKSEENALKNEEMKELKHKIQIFESKQLNYVKVIKEKQIEIQQKCVLMEQNESKLEQIKKQMQKYYVNLHEQKLRYKQLLKMYQQKVEQFKSYFSQFKYELGINLKMVLTSLKKQLSELSFQVENYKTSFSILKSKSLETFFKKAQHFHNQHTIDLNQLKQKYENGVIFQLISSSKQELLAKENEWKHEKMQFLMILAEKQLQLKSHIESEYVLKRRVKELQVKDKNEGGRLNESERKNEELKIIVNGLTEKMVQQQKLNVNYHEERQFYKKQSLQLQEKMLHMQKKFKETVQACKEKYKAQNYKLFEKYEQEMNKFIANNQIRPNQNYQQANSIQIPTKQCTRGTHLQKIMREIQEQKRKINILEQGKSPHKKKYQVDKFQKTILRVISEKDIARHEKQSKRKL